MARRKARMPQGKKIQPAVKTMAFNFTNGQENYIDISQCASLVNRRFYRQGLNWAVAGFTLITTPSTSGNFIIQKIPDTWVASNAWHKGFATWNKLNDEALEEAESVKAKFTDFKVYMDAAHHTAGSGDNLLPVDSVGTPYTEGAWVYSKQVIPRTDGTDGVNNFEIIWTGANYPGSSPATGLNAVSLIEGYAASRGLPDIRDPNVPDDAYDADGPTPENWMTATFNEGTTQDDNVLTDVILENNTAPYPFENDGTATDTQYPGGANQAPGLEIVDWVGVSATTIGNVTKIGGSNFQGGLIKIANDFTGGTGNHALLLHLVPGPHRGYMCQPMQDV